METDKHEETETDMDTDTDKNTVTKHHGYIVVGLTDVFLTSCVLYLVLCTYIIINANQRVYNFNWMSFNN